VLLWGAVALDDIASAVDAVSLCNLVDGDFACLLWVQLFISLADHFRSGISQFFAEIFNERTPVDLRLIPVLLVVAEECVVVSLIKYKLELVECPHQFVQADHVVALNKAMDHAREVQSWCLVNVCSNQVENVVSTDFGLGSDWLGLGCARCHAELPQVLRTCVFMNILAHLGSL